MLNTRNRTLEKNGNAYQADAGGVRDHEAVHAESRAGRFPGRTFCAAVWGRDYEGELKIVDVNIRRLRIKIEDDTTNPTYITTVWGSGLQVGRLTRNVNSEIA